MGRDSLKAEVVVGYRKAIRESRHNVAVARVRARLVQSIDPFPDTDPRLASKWLPSLLRCSAFVLS